ncbi:MAG: DEAD/DEAH box helicase [Phycisphaerales bacterium]|nr:DEAD/DEAH box helicase [Phycisphaerales bacterium]
MALREFDPVIQTWFAAKFGQPTEPQRDGWPHIRTGANTLIAAPTGTGKTLTAFLSAIDSLIQHRGLLPDETRVLYISPLRALSNDVQKNLQQPLSELMALDRSLPDVRVLVRTGDTSQSERAAMVRRPPHILVTTPESLYILLTSGGGQRMLRTVQTVIVDEIHSLARDKRGSHLALSLERLEMLCGPVQRIGLSATQKPLSEVAKFLIGVDRDCALVDVGHRREMDLAIETPPSPLATVCSHEQWEEIFQIVMALIAEHRTTLIFVNTRKLAERVAAKLTELMGEDEVTCHHSSLSQERRHDAEQRLKAGKLRALVATASLELGIDIGEVDLVIQLGATRSIATFLQRVGRSGHAIRRVPKGRLFPLTIDELVEAAALLRCVREGTLDRTPQPAAPLDILAQQIVATCVSAGDPGVFEDELFDRLRRAWPYRELSRVDFDLAVRLHTEGRHGLLHRDGVERRLMARKRARIASVTGGGAIPDITDFQVREDPDDTFIGTLNEDFAIESSTGDVFQLGNASWRIIRLERGVVRVVDAKGQPPTIPFWLGEGPSRTSELSCEIGRVREEAHDPSILQREIGLSAGAARQIADYIAEGRRVLGTVPTQKRVVLERFFDESGGMQMVVHAPFGGRINRGWGLALRKRFCRGFGFELQAAANEEAIIISLGLQHSFPLEEVFGFLHPDTVQKTLTQAVLDQPMFESRWRWNATRALVLERFQHGKVVAPAIMRMRAADLLAQTFPHAVACPENLPAGDLPVPMDHPLVRQTVEDCLSEATDIIGLRDVLRELREGRIERIAVDTPEPSVFARGILNSQPYSFLDDAPLEERRTQAVISRRTLDPRTLDEIGALDPNAVARVCEEAWPTPASMEEVHEALLWMGYVADEEAVPWLGWLTQLASRQRVERRDGCWLAVDGPRDAKAILRGRLEALGPVFEGDARLRLPIAPADGTDANDVQHTLLTLEREGGVLRTRLAGRTAWCERRLLARIHRYTLDTLRREIEPVSAAEFLRFLACWQHVDEEHRLEGPRGVAEALEQLAGFEAPVRAWESSILPRRVRDYRREWLDELTLSGEFAWGRLWGGGRCAVRVAPLTFVRREDLETWLALAGEAPLADLGGPAADVLEALRGRGAMFPQELQRAAGLVAAHFEIGAAELIALGAATCDSFAAVRQMTTPPSRRRGPVRSVGRWSLFRAPREAAEADEFVARRMLARTGVVFRQTMARERVPVPWGGLIRVLRRMELRGEVRGGRFVAGFSGEQYALPGAVEMLRRLRRAGARAAVAVESADPLNYSGILNREERVSPMTRRYVQVG